MNKKSKKYLTEFMKLFVLLAIILNVVSYYRSLDLNKEKLDIDTFELLDNSMYKVPQNKPILIHFWATWCPTCKFESTNIDKISKDYEVITIAVESGSKEEIQKYLDEHKLTFKVVNDKDGFFSRNFNIKVYPTTIIYDKDKKQKFSDVGYTTTVSLYSKMILAK